MQFSASKFIASERVSVSKYDMLINTHCGESKTSLYQVARNLSISYAYARIVNETVRNTKKTSFPAYLCCPAFIAVYQLPKNIEVADKEFIKGLELILKSSVLD